MPGGQGAQLPSLLYCTRGTQAVMEGLGLGLRVTVAVGEGVREGDSEYVVDGDLEPVWDWVRLLDGEGEKVVESDGDGDADADRLPVRVGVAVKEGGEEGGGGGEGDTAAADVMMVAKQRATEVTNNKTGSPRLHRPGAGVTVELHRWGMGVALAAPGPVLLGPNQTRTPRLRRPDICCS